MKNLRLLLLFTALFLCGSLGFSQKSGKGKKPEPNRTIPKEVRAESWDPADIPDEEDEDAEDEEFDEFDDYNEKTRPSSRATMGISGKAGVGRTSASKKQQKSPNNPAIERKAREESRKLARSFKITNKNAQKKLLKACRKYFRALDHLERDYGFSGRAAVDGKSGQSRPAGQRAFAARASGKRSKDYFKRKRELGVAYGQELREVLPEF